MVLELIELIWIAALGIASGTLGGLAGIGGGVIIVPVLVILLGFDFPTSVAASLAGVIATSIAAGTTYVGEGLTNMRLAMTLQVATTLGGIGGGFLGVLLTERFLASVFAVSMAGTSILVARSRGAYRLDIALADNHSSIEGGKPSVGGPLDARYRDPGTGLRVTYHVRRVLFGFGVSYAAGMFSGLLGIGGGFIQVPAMNLGMGVPIKVAAATSNFMIGVTAASSLVVYLGRGEVHPAIVTPLVLGTIAGALIGSRLQGRVASHHVRMILSIVLGFVALQMGLRALGVAGD